MITQLRLYFLTILIPAISLSQESKSMSVLVSSSDSTSLPFASIYSTSANFGTYSDSKGIFYISNDLDSLTISHVGYLTKRIAISNIKDTVFLNERVNELDEVIVSSSKRNKTKSHLVGYYKNKISGYYLGKQSMALLIENPSKELRHIKEITGKLGVSKDHYKWKYNTNAPKHQDILIRINLFQKLDSLEYPSNYLINTEDIRIRISKKQKKFSYEISSKNLYFPSNGVFVGIEFLGYFQSDQFVPFSTSDKENIIHFQVAFSGNHKKAESWIKDNQSETWRLLNKECPTPSCNFNFGLVLQ